MGRTPKRVDDLFYAVGRPQPLGSGARRRTLSAPAAQPGRADLLILDDWGREQLDTVRRLDLLEILEERYGRRSTMITSQLPVECWHEIIGDPLCRLLYWTVSSVATRRCFASQTGGLGFSGDTVLVSPSTTFAPTDGSPGALGQTHCGAFSWLQSQDAEQTLLVHGAAYRNRGIKPAVHDWILLSRQ